MIRIPYIFLSLLMLTQISCITEIKWEGADTSTHNLVVEGLLTDVEQEHIVKLSRTLPVVGNKNPETVSGAQVTINDGTTTFELAEKEPGIYATNNNVKGEIGKKYTLHIRLEGKDYYASDSLVAAPSIEPVEYTTSQFNDDFYMFTLRGNFGSAVPYKYRMVYQIPDDASEYYPPGWEAPDWYTRRISENDRILLDSTFFIHGAVEPAALLIYGEYTRNGILRGTMITEYVHSMSNSYYQFIRAMMSETEWRGVGVVGSIPANVPGNISNGAYGFFAVSSIKITETLIE
ncbi:DUF4249 domain-containing protein [Mariniphaga sediminis]|uniref:DUF4249 domain-containing protein n=1 Tax=Mariniphaga sediminis TaxID=1628158 RepID=A0A399D011_9BACT|nr:DUF4249 family protein [Mariniphaga sediminis]RIH64082.1 DUF4249 domain-containing protein [Mariniphaga sediminis]